MAEETLSPSPVIVNIINSTEDNTNGDPVELVVSSTDEISGINTEDTGLVVSASDTDQSSGSIGSIQSGDDAGSASIGSAAIEIAGIEAERDITIAVIDAETERARIEASTASDGELEDLSWQMRLTTLETELAEIKNLLTPQPLSEPAEEVIMQEIREPAQDELSTPSEPNSTSEFMSVPTVETSPALSEIENQVDADLAKLKPKFIPI